jgi:hypothetical protein
MTTTTAEMGLSRMSDEDYSSEFGTPRPGTREITASIPRWIFDRSAKANARESKRNIVSRTDYRMAANKKVTDAIVALEKSCNYNGEVTQADFQLLKKAIEKFNVRIRVHDSITVSDLMAMRAKFQKDLVERENMTPIKEIDLTQWITALTDELRRVNSMRPTGVPSQQAEIMRSSASALCKVLSPETIRRKFISLEKLTSAIRTDLVAFLTSEARKHDRAEFVKQIKDANSRKTRKVSH